MKCDENIKKLRMAIHLSQTEYAELIGVSKSSISHYEAGNRIPAPKTVRRLLEIAKQNKVKMSFEDFYND